MLKTVISEFKKDMSYKWTRQDKIHIAMLAACAIGTYFVALLTV